MRPDLRPFPLACAVLLSTHAWAAPECPRGTWHDPSTGQCEQIQMSGSGVAREQTSFGYGLRKAEPNSLLLGSRSNEEGREEDELRRATTLTSAYWIGETEVTQQQWANVWAADPKPDPELPEAPWRRSWGQTSLFGADRPVQNVTWCEAIRFANAASRVEGREPAYHIPTPCNTRGGPKLRPNLQMPGFRLPTVVEWEMAARSDGGEAWGRTGMEHELCAFANVRDLSAALAFGWSSGALCDDGSAGTWNVGGGGRAAGNALGLVDMIGNVREWCWDAYAPRNPNARVDPPTTDKGTRREERGGSWRTSARWARIANRSSSSRTFHGDDLGFRLGRSVRPTTGRR